MGATCSSGAVCSAIQELLVEAQGAGCDESPRDVEVRGLEAPVECSPAAARELLASMPTLHLASPSGKSLGSWPPSPRLPEGDGLVSPRPGTSAGPGSSSPSTPRAGVSEAGKQQSESLPAFVNDMMEHAWPCISDFVFDIVGRTIEPAIKSAMGTMGNKFAFDLKACTLGSKPARFTTIETHRAVQIVADGKLDNIVIKGKLEWEGNVRIMTRFGSLLIGVKRVKVSGDLVTECVGMMPRPPFFQGARVFFVNPPRVELEFRGRLARVLEVRPIKKQVMKELERQISTRFVVPNLFGIQLDPQSEIFRIVRPRPKGILKLRVVRAEGLPAMDSGWTSTRAQSSDPYVVVRCGAERFRSATVRRTLSPEFDFEVRLPIVTVRHQRLHLDLWDADFAKKDDFLGTVAIGVGELIHASRRGGGAAWFNLADRKAGPDGTRGRVLVAAEWRPLILDAHTPSPDDHGLVFAGIYSASQLPGLAEGTRYWVAGSCTHLLPGRALDPPPALKQLDGRARTSQLARPAADPMRADTTEAAAARALLERRLQILQARGLTSQEIAEVLGVDEQSVRRQATGEAQLRDVQATQRHTMEWNQGFDFLVSSAKSAVVTLDLRCAEPGGCADGSSLGTVSMPVADLLEKSACTSVESVSVPGTDMTLKVRFQVRHLGAADDDAASSNSV